MVPLAPLLAILGVMLALSLAVERFLTIFSWIVDRFWVMKVSWKWTGVEEFDTRRRLAERARSEEKVLDASPDGVDVDPRANDPHEIEPFPDPSAAAAPDGRFLLHGITLPKETPILKEFYLQILGTIAAVFICMNADFSAFGLLRWSPGEPIAVPPPEAWEFLLTGVIIGSGSKPVHFLIDFLVNRKIRQTREEVERQALPDRSAEIEPAVKKDEAPTPTAPALVAAPTALEKYVGFRYDGGDRPDRLEHTHIRTTRPNLIVYHHTAMHSDASFAGLVKEFDRKNWLTGYHCVVFKDGAVRALCRWDRTGNHARGCNYRSFGIAFQGNFETDPSQPFSNADGRLGNQHPTPEQLDAAARVTALWVHLYDVPLCFPSDGPVRLSAEQIAANLKESTGIVPHNFVAAKACPGSNFPHDVFQSLVRDYHRLWTEDDAFGDALTRFKRAPMVMTA